MMSRVSSPADRRLYARCGGEDDDLWEIGLRCAGGLPWAFLRDTSKPGGQSQVDGGTMVS